MPLQDDTPTNYKPPTSRTVVTIIKGPQEAEPSPRSSRPSRRRCSARIIGVQVVGGGTQITVGRGTATGAATGMKGKIDGVATGAFPLGACNERHVHGDRRGDPGSDQERPAAPSVLTP